MIFNSIPFLIFFPVFLACYLSTRGRVRLWILLVASYGFYAWWNWKLLPLLWFQTTLDYFVGRRLGHEPDAKVRKRLVVLSMAANLLLLAFFKYFHFGINTVRAAFRLAGIDVPDVALQIVLPVGISFYTFQSMSYVLDIYRGEIKPEPSLLRFATSVAMFVHLVAGPIVRARHLIPQLRTDQKLDVARVTAGFEQVLWGFFKKVAVADSLAPLVEIPFAQPAVHDGMTIVLGIYFYAFQIYCDFSGYTDIALGCAKILGYDLGTNFNRPYFSRGFSEFWTRWHISLSSWLRDYLYIPLGGSRSGSFRTYVNLMLTMLIGGLWHGANWTFVVWGGLHGLYLAVERLLRPTLSRAARALRVPHVVVGLIAGLIVFHAVTFSWIFFRAQNFTLAWQMIYGIATRFSPSFAQVQQKFLVYRAILLVLVLVTVEALSFHPTLFDRIRAVPALRYANAALILLGIALFGTFSGASFIYFQF